MKRIEYQKIFFAAATSLVFGAACQSEQVRVVSVQTLDARKVGIGFIENRDIRYSPFSSKNFSDMLSFELMQNGYRLRDVDFAVIRENSPVSSQVGERATGGGEADLARPESGAKEAAESDAASPETLETSGGEAGEDAENNAEPAVLENNDSANANSIDEESYADDILPARSEFTKSDGRDAEIDPARISDGTRDLLPERLRSIAGELQARERIVDPENRRLSGAEIARLAQANGLDFYIQGAIGRNETGLILETEQNTLVFLEVFDPQGERVGAINLSVNDETLRRSSFLQEISAEIIRAFDREIGR